MINIFFSIYKDLRIIFGWIRHVISVIAIVYFHDNKKTVNKAKLDRIIKTRAQEYEINILLLIFKEARSILATQFLQNEQKVKQLMKKVVSLAIFVQMSTAVKPYKYLRCAERSWTSW